MPTDLDLNEARRCGRQLAAAGAALVRAGYSERAVCAWFGVELVTDVRWVGLPPAERSRRGLGAAIALLLGGEVVERRALPFLDDPALDALVAVGLVQRSGTSLRARASVLPIQGVLVAADRLDDENPGAVCSPDLSALNVAGCLPRGGTLLDVGCGAGALSLVAARTGSRVIGTDIDRRALGFATINALLNDLPAAFLQGDLYAGVEAAADCVVMNAPLVRAPLLSEAPLYMRSPRGEALAVEFLEGARGRTRPGGEALCHVQLTPGVEAAAERAGFERRLALHFADATDGTPHVLLSLREGEPGYAARIRTPLSAALRHLRREALERLHATRELLVRGDAELAAAVLRPAPWLSLLHTAVHDGGGFRLHDVRLGVHRLEPSDLALLEACAGSPLGEVADGELRRARALADRGLLVA